MAVSWEVPAVLLTLAASPVAAASAVSSASAVSADDDDVRVGANRPNDERHDEANVSVAPYTDGLAAIVGHRLEARHGVHDHAHELGERGDVLVDTLR